MNQPPENSTRFSFLNFAGKLIVFSMIFVSFGFSEINIYGQSDINLPGIDQTFTPKLSKAGWIDRAIVQPDGKIIAMGQFTEANGFQRRGIIRINSDNTIDASFRIMVEGNVRNMELLPDGKFIYQGTNSIYRLNSDGSIDPSFTFARTVSTSSALNFRPRSDGKIFVFGSFKVKRSNTVIAENFMLLDQFGGIESAFRPDMTGSVSDVLSLPDGRTIICGDFELKHLGFNIGRNVAVLNENGAINLDFAGFYGKASGEYVRGVQMQPDGKLLIYGELTEASKQTFGGKIYRNNGIFRLNADGSIDRSFIVPFSYATFYSMLVQPDGKILLRGVTRLPGSTAYSIFNRLLPDGRIDQTFNDNLPFVSGFNLDFSRWEFAPDGKIMMSGKFKVTGRPDVQQLIKLNADGTLDQTFQLPRVTGSFRHFESLTGGNILIYGAIGKIGSHTRIGMARLNLNGLLDENFRCDVLINELVRVYNVTLQSDGKYLVSGDFQVVNGEYVANNFSQPLFNYPESTYNPLIRLNTNGSLDETFTPYSNEFDEIRRVALQTDGKILVAGKVRSHLEPNNLVRLNADGTPDTSFNRLRLARNNTLGTVVTDLAVQPDGKMIIGGNFTHVGGIYRQYIARLNQDGLLDESFNYTDYINESDVTYKVALQSDGKIIKTGEFMTGFSSPGLARLNRNGTLDARFKWNRIFVPTSMRDLQLLPDGRILFSGQIGLSGSEVFHPNSLILMNQNGEIERSYDVKPSRFLRQSDGKIILFEWNEQGSGYLLRRIFPDGSVDNTFRFTMDFPVNNIVEQPDGKIVIAGAFMNINNVRQLGLVRLDP